MPLNGKAAKQALQLLLIEHNANCCRLWPFEHVFFEAFMPQGKPRGIPLQYLYFVAALVGK
jgi:hypothetical protein